MPRTRPLGDPDPDTEPDDDEPEENPTAPAAFELPPLKPFPLSARRLEYIPLAELKTALGNPKRHDVPAIIASMARGGYTAPIILDERTGRMVAGHGRLTALKSMKALGETPPDGIEVVDGEWLVPVSRGWASQNDEAAAVILLGDNAITAKGGWDDRELVASLQKLGSFVGSGFDDTDLKALMKKLDDEGKPEPKGKEVSFTAKEPDPVECPKCGHTWIDE